MSNIITSAPVKGVAIRGGVPEAPHECCRDGQYLIVERTIGTAPVRRLGKVSLRRDIGMRRCRVCKCRHFEQMLDPGEIGMALKPINRRA